jgi:hypothetical protein
MPRIKKKKIVETDIAVFSFSKNSQIRDIPLNRISYNYVLDLLNKMMIEEGVKSDKIGLGGYVTDIAFFISGMIEIYSNNNISLELDTDNFDSTEFDPDFVRNNI